MSSRWVSIKLGQSSQLALTKFLVSTFNPIVLHLAVKLLYAVVLLFKLRVSPLLLECRLLEWLLIPKRLSLLSECVQIDDFCPTSLLRFTRLLIILSAVLLEAALGLEWSIFYFVRRLSTTYLLEFLLLRLEPSDAPDDFL